MNSQSQNHSVMAEITKAEEAISICYQRVYQLKSKLNNRQLTSERKDLLKQDLIEVEKLLATNKKILKKIHKQNKTTFYVAVSAFLTIFIIWMLYHLLLRD